MLSKTGVSQFSYWRNSNIDENSGNGDRMVTVIMVTVLTTTTLLTNEQNEHMTLKNPKEILNLI
jgi:hypothetical protein